MGCENPDLKLTLTQLQDDDDLVFSSSSSFQNETNYMQTSQRVSRYKCAVKGRGGGGGALAR